MTNPKKEHSPDNLKPQEDIPAVLNEGSPREASEGHEQEPPALELGFRRDNLVPITSSVITTIEAMIRDMKGQGSDLKQIEFALYDRLESMGIDLAHVRDNAVVVDFVHDNGVNEPLAIDISPKDFGTVILGVNMHEMLGGTGDEPVDQDKLTEDLASERGAAIEEIRKLIDIEASDVPESMLVAYRDALHQLAQSINRGSVRPQDLPEFTELSAQVGGKFAAEGQRRAERQRVVMTHTITEQFQDLQANLNESAACAESITAKLRRIVNGLEEMQHDRYGHEAQYSMLRSLLQSLDAEFDNDRGITLRTRNILEQV